MPRPSFESTPLDPDGFLADETPLRAARGVIARSPEPIHAVSGRGGIRALLEEDLRFAIADGSGPDRPIREIARADLLCPDEASARALLERETGLAAVLVGGGGGDGPLRALKRVTAELRIAVVMAGGLGLRLLPLTTHTPKPLLEVGGRVLLFRILDRLAAHGVERVFISINHLGDKVRDAVGDGSDWDLEVSYLEEDEPLDTGAGLVRLGPLDEPFYLVNGDILTDMNFRSLARHHLLRENLATVATYLFPAPLPYGVVHPDGERIVGIEEKPVLRYPVNAGIYAFSPEILDLVPEGKPLGLVGFLNELIGQGRAIGRFPLIEYWNDVGSRTDFERAQEEAPAL